jgi:hypothetical protein
MISAAFLLFGDATPKMRKKSDLAQSICAACRMPVVWRKKWASDGEGVRYCLKKCRKACGLILRP